MTGFSVHQGKSLMGTGQAGRMLPGWGINEGCWEMTWGRRTSLLESLKLLLLMTLAGQHPLKAGGGFSLKIFFLTCTIFKVFIEFVTILLLCFFILMFFGGFVLAPRHVGS